MKPHEALLEAISIMKTQKGLADAVGCAQPVISGFVKRGNGASPALCVPISLAVGGAVTPLQLCPRAFPVGYETPITA
ncbi:MAG: helix-turn-helix domain-containing protein [Crocinitomicaceae bacterium]|nr:helix-turn-helix domain-containing protein [Crocinitomicaceae bacterium]